MRPCSTDRSHSPAGLWPYPLGRIFSAPKPTEIHLSVMPLRYSLGGCRPSKTTNHALLPKTDCSDRSWERCAPFGGGRDGSGGQARWAGPPKPQFVGGTRARSCVVPPPEAIRSSGGDFIFPHRCPLPPASKPATAGGTKLDNNLVIVTVRKLRHRRAAPTGDSAPLGRLALAGLQNFRFVVQTLARTPKRK